jgi:dihydroflavonol-4-reductase
MDPDPRFWAGRTVCVTGGTGFLGYHLVQQLVSVGAQVRVLALPPGPDHPLLGLPTVEQHHGDVRDAAVVRRATADCSVIFHTAGVVAVWGPALARMHSVHVNGTRQVLDAAPPYARVVHTSSLVAVGASRAAEVLTEESPFNLAALRIDYVQAKRAAEQIALDAAQRGRPVVVTNPGYLVGPDDHERSVMGRFCLRFWKGRLLLAPAGGGWNLVDVRDVARGHLLAAEHGQPGRRYLLGGENLRIPDFMALLARVAGLRPRLLPSLPGWALYALAGASTCRAWFTNREPYPSLQHVRLNRYHWFCRSDRARHELGYQARPLAQTLADTYHWYRARGEIRWHGLSRWWMQPPESSRAA